jgi:hypothetical protein
MANSTNPVAEAITEKIKELMLDDLSKADIREIIKTAHPNFPAQLFEASYSEAFTAIVG